MGVREATRDDLWDVARIHKARFGTPDYALGQYPIAIISNFYALFLGRCVFLVHVSDRGVDGFILGGEARHLRGAERAFVWNNIVPLRFGNITPSPSLAGCLPQCPQIIRIADQESSCNGRRRSCLDCFPAVDKTAEGGGAAVALMEAFGSSISGRYTAYLLSVIPTNRRAVQSYKKLGLTIVEDASPDHFTFQREFKLPCGSSPQEP